MLNRGEIIHQSQDRLGNILVVDYRKHRVLTFDSAFEQSKIDRRRPYLPVHEYNRAMMLPAAFIQPAHVTILGLGGGVMASAFHHLFPQCHIHAVELRSAVVEVSRAYFGLPDSHRLSVTVADARDTLLKLPEASTDLILADLYSADRMSPAQAQRLFIDQCCRVLTGAGWLALNYHRPPDPDSACFRQLRQRFARLLVFQSKTNNTVVFASKAPFEALHSRDPSLVALEQRLPIAWRKLMARVRPI